MPTDSQHQQASPSANAEDKPLIPSGMASAQTQLIEIAQAGTSQPESVIATKAPDLDAEASPPDAARFPASGSDTQEPLAAQALNSADTEGDAAVAARRKRKPDTENAYTYRVQLLWRQAQAARTTDYEDPPLLTPTQVVEFLIWRSREVQYRTWMLYRSALIWDFGRRAEQSGYAEALQLLQQSRFGFDQKEPRTERLRKSRSAKRGIPKSDLVHLLDKLGTMNRTVGWGARTQYWLHAAIASGLRPGEWERASWSDEGKTLLMVETSKRKEDVAAFHRDNPEMAEKLRAAKQNQVPRVRAVPIDPADRLYVDLHLAAIRGSGVSFRSYYDNCRAILWDACRQIWKGKKLYSLYSGRHQFSANHKAEYPLADTAEVMGHESDRSSLEYASAKHAHKERRAGGGQREHEQHDADELDIDPFVSRGPSAMGTTPATTAAREGAAQAGPADRDGSPAETVES